MIVMLLYLGYAEVLEFKVDVNGNPLYRVKEGGAIYDDVPLMMVGGSPNNLGFRPIEATTDRLINPKDYLGCIAVILKPRKGEPLIIGTVNSPVNARDDFSEEREYTPDGQLLIEKHCVHDETSKLDGSFRSLGAQGITLDTTSSGEPIRLQLSGSSHLRISQTNSLTIDHIVLSSKLMEKLSELETVIAAMATRIDLLTEICADVEIAKAALDNTHIPRVTVAAPNMSVWEKGSDASYQADCARISNKSREDSA